MDEGPVDRWADLRGLRFHYQEYAGDRSGAERRAIVLLHGLASNARWWQLVAPLLAHRFRVVALNQRGHGQTDKPEGGYDFVSVIGDLDAFFTELRIERPVIVGHSWGGNVALEFAATHTDRTCGLVLVDGGFLELQARPGMTWERAERELAPPDMTSLTPQRLVELAKQWELGPIWSDQIESALLANFEVTEAGTIRPHLARDRHMRVVRALWDQRPSELYPRIACPVLFALAERSSGRGREWTELKHDAIAKAEAALADCRVVWFADTIHDIPLHRPVELAQAIERFADSLDA
jgi:pimeloyl-ACP methyl ester carboxylesterase